MYCEDCDREGVAVDSVRDCARCAAIKARGGRASWRSESTPAAALSKSQRPVSASSALGAPYNSGNDALLGGESGGAGASGSYDSGGSSSDSGGGGGGE